MGKLTKKADKLNGKRAPLHVMDKPKPESRSLVHFKTFTADYIERNRSKAWKYAV